MTVISFEKRFVFIKTQKTAGTSIEVDLSRWVGDTGIVTPIFPEVPGHRARNFAQGGNPQAFYNHMPATEVRNLIGSERFSGMYRFCVERDPIDKCISHFHMLRNSAAHSGGGTYASSWNDYCFEGRFPIDVGKYTENRNGKLDLIVDRVIRYDRLETELAEVMQHIGMPDFKLQARAKSEFRTRALVHREDVTPRQRARILEAFAKTLEVTGIDWDKPPVRTSPVNAQA